MNKKQDPTETAVLVMIELKETIREGRELLKDLNAEHRAVRALIDSLPARMQAELGREVERQVAHLGEATRQAMDAAVERVTRSFDKIVRVLTAAEQRAPRSSRTTEIAFLLQKPPKSPDDLQP